MQCGSSGGLWCGRIIIVEGNVGIIVGAKDIDFNGSLKGEGHYAILLPGIEEGLGKAKHLRIVGVGALSSWIYLTH